MHHLTLARPGHHCPGSLLLPIKQANQEGVRCLDAVLASCRCRHTLTPSPCLSPRRVSGPVCSDPRDPLPRNDQGSDAVEDESENSSSFAQSLNLRSPSWN